MFHDGAARLILDAAENFPYFIQEWGFQVWNAAQASPITTAMARAASPDVVAHLDNNFFRVRFDRLTPLEQKYLRAMAELGGGAARHRAHRRDVGRAAFQCRHSAPASH